jgi:hypothetical protein
MFVKEPYAGYYDYGFGDGREAPGGASTETADRRAPASVEQSRRASGSTYQTANVVGLPSESGRAYTPSTQQQDVASERRSAVKPTRAKEVTAAPTAADSSSTTPDIDAATLAAIQQRFGSGSSSGSGAGTGAGTGAGQVTGTGTGTGTGTAASSTASSSVLPIAAGVGIGLLALRFLRG